MPSPNGPADSLDPMGESAGNADAAWGLPTSRSVSGRGACHSREEPAPTWIFGGDGGAAVFLPLAGDAGIPGEGPDASSVCLSDGAGEAALTSVTKRARSVAAGLVSVPKTRRSPPRSSACSTLDATIQRYHCPLGCHASEGTRRPTPPPRPTPESPLSAQRDFPDPLPHSERWQFKSVNSNSRIGS